MQTQENLLEIIAKQPTILHISCHCLENTPYNLGEYYQKTKNDGNFLIFENKEGGSDLVS